jgi:radical SAM superfamily enzyme YgiQ (UPF0313 family)
LVNSPAIPAPEFAHPLTDQSYFDMYKRYMTPDQYYSFPMEQLGIMSIKAYARSKHVTVHTVNGLVSGHSSLEQTWRAVESLARRHGPPTLVGFSCINTLDEVVSLAERCTRAWGDTKIAIGNTFGTLNFERILRQYDVFDFVVIGEGEQTFTLLAEALLNGRRHSDIPGLAWRSDDGTVKMTPPNLLDIDDLPWPCRDELPAVMAEGFAGAVFSTRGCPYRCTFCGTGAVAALQGPKSYRAKSVHNVADEIEYLKKDFGIGFLVITDDLFVTKSPHSRERAIELADELIHRNLGVEFMLDARVDSIEREAFAHLKQAGLRRVFVGIESGSYEQLVSFNKRYVKRGDNPAERLRTLTDLGIEVIPGVMTFHPTVRPAELRQTLDVLRATGYESPHMLYDRVTAYAGTPLYQEYKAKGYLKTEWPVGEWDFVDTRAETAYRRIFEHIVRNEGITLSEASKFFIGCLEEWEASPPSPPRGA